MTAGGSHNIKYNKQLEFYHNYMGDKCSYSVFNARVHQQGLTYEDAIKKDSLRGKHMIKTEIKDNGRICTICGIFKTRDYFSKTKTTSTGRTPNCLECRNKYKNKYRKETNYEKDRYYKKIHRTLNIGTKIAMHNPRYIGGLPREDIYTVIEYKYKKGYLIKSDIDGLYKWIDLGDNGTRPNFYFV